MDVAAWLHDLGLERYVSAFRDNDVEAEVLLKLTAEDLISRPVAHAMLEAYSKARSAARHYPASRSGRSRPRRRRAIGLRRGRGGRAHAEMARSLQRTSLLQNAK
jgi:SAM domain (Sterile alpha motif)